MVSGDVETYAVADAPVATAPLARMGLADADAALGDRSRSGA